MIDGTVLFAVAMAYLALLFAIAYYGDIRARQRILTRASPYIYSLSLAVYCTSWTFFGNVGTAASQGWNFIPIYMGPVILLLVFTPFLRRLIRAAKRHNITSISDFIASRYGKTQALAVLVTLIAVIGILPYIALQLKGVASAYTALTSPVLGGDNAAAGHAQGPWGDTALLVALIMAGFSILFGTRSVNTTESHRGMVLAIAFESLVKLAAFLAVGAFVTFSLFGGPGALWHKAMQASEFTKLYSEPWLTSSFVNDTLLAMVAMFCLPRLFHVGVVENGDERHVKTARWVFSSYMMVFALFVVPIAAAGLLLFPHAGIRPDSFVFNVPRASGHGLLGALAFIGGLSASTGMVIVATVTLSTMVCNDIIMPLLLRVPAFRATHPLGRDMSGLLLGIRRVTIIALALLGYLYYLAVGEYATLASTGLLSFAAVAQCAPAIIAGLYWRRANFKGAMAGLAAGFAVWCYTLLLPLLADIGLLPATFVSQGPWAIAWLRPQALFGLLQGWDPLVNGVFWSLLLNIAVLVVVSLLTRQGLMERMQAASYLESGESGRVRWALRGWSATTRELQGLLGRFMGDVSAARAFAAYQGERSGPLHPDTPVDSELVDYTEYLLTGVLGSSSARLLLESALAGREVPLQDVVSILNQTSQAIQFNREMLQATLENMAQGVSVIDEELKLVAWNKRYLELFQYPQGLVKVGRSVAELVRYNAERGECGPGGVEEHVEKRLAHWRAGHPHVFQRWRGNGTVLEMRGNPLPGGGFVTTFADITEYKRSEQALKDINATLEERVTARTRELSRANQALSRAKAEAERANRSKTQFLAAAGHDLMQPLHAARLFGSALASAPAAQQRELTEQLDNALESAEELLGGLLDTSRLDAGALKADVRVFGVHSILSSLVDEFGVMARERGLELRWVPSRVPIRSDARLLRRIVQNLLSNAVRYTRNGSVLLGCRRRGEHLRIEVWDTGPGISEERLEAIFEEFRRFEGEDSAFPGGLGLGLSIARRMADMLEHRIDVSSVPGYGTVFSVTVPRVRQAVRAMPLGAAALVGVRVLCADDDPTVLEAMQALMAGWGCEVMTADSVEQALFFAQRDWAAPDIVLADYHFHAEENGFELVTKLRAHWHQGLPGVIITADPDEAVAHAAASHGCAFLRKPVPPAALRALLTRLVQAPATAAMAGGNGGAI
jgi:PAS domain S-box-containing protein